MPNLIDLCEARTYTADDGFSLVYRIYIPADYDPAKKYPFLLYLHSKGGRGDDNERQFRHGISEMFAVPDSPLAESVILVPQCPTDCRWVNTRGLEGTYSVKTIPESRALTAVMHLVDEMAAAYSLDEDRFYVAGYSMGASGTWDVLSRHGERFAAGLSISGRGDPGCADVLRNIPIRTFHGDADEIVTVEGTRAMAAAITKNGTDKSARLTYVEFEGWGHSIWKRVLSDPDNTAWLFAQKRSDRA